jgi:hypothetical protein
MAAGLIGHLISYGDYVRMPVYDDYKWKARMSEKVRLMNSQDMLEDSQRVKIRPEKSVVMQLRGVAS